MALRILDTAMITKGELHVVAVGNKTYIHFQSEQGHGVFKEADRATSRRVHNALVEAIQAEPCTLCCGVLTTGKLTKELQSVCSQCAARTAKPNLNRQTRES